MFNVDCVVTGPDGQYRSSGHHNIQDQHFAIKLFGELEVEAKMALVTLGKGAQAHITMTEDGQRVMSSLL